MYNYGIDAKFLYGNTCFDENPIGINKSFQKNNRAKVQNAPKVYLNKYDSVAISLTAKGIKVANLSNSSVTRRRNSSGVWIEIIKDSREKLGIGQRELGEILGLSESTIQKLEAGESTTPVTNTKEKLIKFKEIIDFVWSKSKQKKYLFRSSFTTELSALGEMSPLQYLASKNNDPYSLNDISGLFRRMYE